MDEPLSNLDAKLRVSILTQVKKLSHELKVTGIRVTHDQTEAMALAHRAVMTATGVVQQVGTPTGTNPANDRVTGFIGSPVMKLVKVRTAAGIFKSGHMKIEGQSATDGPITVEFRAEGAGLGSEGHDENQVSIYTIELLGNTAMVTMRRRRVGLGQGPHGLPRRHRRYGQPEYRSRNYRLFDARTGARAEA